LAAAHLCEAHAKFVQVGYFVQDLVDFQFHENPLGARRVARFLCTPNVGIEKEQGARRGGRPVSCL
jgi:hypothetical protein